MLRYLSGGESHGKQLTAVICEYPSGVEIDPSVVNNELKRRQAGYGRGGRMKIESDTVEIVSGVRWGKTTGAPITLVIENKDWENWEKIMSVCPDDVDNSKIITRPRPGHSDLPGMVKYNHKDARNILERSSARETAIRTAVGSFGKILLNIFDINIFSHVKCIGSVTAETKGLSYKEIQKRILKSELNCADPKAEIEMKKIIDKAKDKGDSLGGIVEIIITGMPVGIGSYIHWDKKLDGILAQAIMSVQAIKGVEIGMGMDVGRNLGSIVQDSIYYSRNKSDYLEGHFKDFPFYHKQNNAGGIEGGMSNGEPIVINAAMKPIPTLMSPLDSVDVNTKEPFKAVKERSDVCAVPAAGVVCEAAAAWALAEIFLEKFGNDAIEDIIANYKNYIKRVKEF